MSYEGKMLEEYKMPSRKDVEKALLKTLFNHNGTLKEFSSDEKIVNELAEEFDLNESQKSAQLETIYRKENRLKKSSLWHRLLFRAADSLSNENLISRPTATRALTNKKEWMLTEAGYDEALKLLNIPPSQKNILLTKSYEVQKIVKKLIENERPENYIPFSTNKKTITITKETLLRERGFRQAVIEAYDYKCSCCGNKIKSPNGLTWEVQAAHIVPHSFKGKDEILNGIALCHLHHWAFDVGWFTLTDSFKIKVSSKINSLSSDSLEINGYNFLEKFTKQETTISLPLNSQIYPHKNSLEWHRENIFFP